MTMSRVPAATCRPRSTSAAAARSSSLALVQVPMKAWSTCRPATRDTGTTLSTLCGQATIGSTAAASDGTARGAARDGLGVDWVGIGVERRVGPARAAGQVVEHRLVGRYEAVLAAHLGH